MTLLYKPRGFIAAALFALLPVPPAIAADARTPNLGLTQPTVGADSDTWGTIINNDLSLIDSTVPTPTLSTTGSAGAYVLTPTNTAYPTSYAQGNVYCAKANFTSVGSDTLNVNGLGAKPLYAITASGLVASAAGTIISGEQFCAAYDSAADSGAGGFQILSGATGYLLSGNNLSDVSNAATARSNLGLGAAATHSIEGNAINLAATNGWTPGLFATWDDSANLGPSSYGASSFDAAGTAAALPNGSRTTIYVETATPNGSANDGDLWIQW